MRKKESYYQALMKEAQSFLEFCDRDFVLRQVIKTKKFKAYLNEKLINEQIPPLFFYDRKRENFIYREG
ncbi:hypothetical protein [Campylobacter cuniculorum]|uniref:Uncharacterized protein n=2 Tax=Campylobacter cuniculorum TaxID=374106 RepID=A0A1W6BYF0_9BACT|nr:hypothetical protein [Campylobacter cuniculorum]ARJ57113.1 hypothetical protein CCUN_1530 [Campylobacter cuniculorum DSM 23162 = LMG 24588]QOR04558.1 hypothetical protein A0071_00995 [Campylobacter cuniculorum]